MNHHHNKVRIVSGVLVLWLLHFEHSFATEPTATELKQAIPVLSPDTEKLNSFHVIGEYLSPLGVPIAFEACWTRNDGFGFIQIDHLGAPVLFVAEKRALLYDASQSKVFLDDNAAPNVLIQSRNRQLAATSGFKSAKYARFIIDLPSLVSTTKHVPVVKQQNETDWDLVYSFDSGADVTYRFKVDDKITFKSAVLSSNQRAIVAVRSVAINKPVPKRMMKFPDADQLPADVKVHNVQSTAELSAAVSYSVAAVRALAASAAIKNADHRGNFFEPDIDWQQVERKHQQIGPKLANLLNGEIKSRVIR